MEARERQNTERETPRDSTAPIIPLLLNAQSAAAICKKSARTWQSWDALGLIPRPVRIGRSTLWRVDELRAWIDAGCPSRDVWEAAQKSSRKPRETDAIKP